MVQVIIFLLVLPILPIFFIRVEGNLVQRTLSALFVDPGQKECSLPTPQQRAYCVKVPGLSSVLSSARKLAHESCQASFQHQFWNCPIPNQASFQIETRETAFLHALYGAAVGYNVAKACGRQELTCDCGPQTRHGTCPDNLQFGLKVARSLLRLNHEEPNQYDGVSKHNTNIGLKVLSRSTKEKCVCKWIMRSCYYKTCYKELWPFMAIVDVLREYYQAAQLYQPSNNIHSSFSRIHHLLYSAPTVFDCETRGRMCLTPEHCAVLCCGRGFHTQTHISFRYCHCRWSTSLPLSLECKVCQNNSVSHTCN